MITQNFIPRKPRFWLFTLTKIWWFKLPSSFLFHLWMTLTILAAMMSYDLFYFDCWQSGAVYPCMAEWSLKQCVSTDRIRLIKISGVSAYLWFLADCKELRKTPESRSLRRGLALGFIKHRRGQPWDDRIMLEFTSSYWTYHTISTEGNKRSHVY